MQSLNHAKEDRKAASSTSVDFEFTADQIAAVKASAMEARDLSYCPYSKFRVGAAILTSTGHVYKGGNIEVASFSAGICAERVAGCKAISDKETIVAVGVASDQINPISPCGECRQFLNEFNPRLEVLLFGTSGEMVHTNLQELLPRAFGPDELH